MAPEPREVWALNKPARRGLDREGARARAGLSRTWSTPQRRLYPVGRLDADSTGLILLTNDGELANRLTHPRYGVPKTYRVELAQPPSERDLERLRTGSGSRTARPRPPRSSAAASARSR